MTKKKTTLPSPRKQDCKKVEVETKKINKVLTDIPTDISELNVLVYAGAKLVCDKIGVTIRNRNRNSKPGWETGITDKEITTNYDNKRKY